MSKEVNRKSDNWRKQRNHAKGKPPEPSVLIYGGVPVYREDEQPKVVPPKKDTD